jgi:hypothetical protein
MQRMHCSLPELMALPLDYYDEAIEMLNEDDRRQQAANERAKMQARRRG